MVLLPRWKPGTVGSGLDGVDTQLVTGDDGHGEPSWGHRLTEQYNGIEFGLVTD